MTDLVSYAEAMRVIVRAEIRRLAAKAELLPHPWYWYYTAEARDERDLARWADDGGRS